MTSGGWAASPGLSSLLIYHICPSGEAGPSLTLSRTGNAIKLVLQEALNLSPSKRAEGLSKMRWGWGQAPAPMPAEPIFQEVSISSIMARTTMWNITSPAMAKVVLIASLTAS